MKIRPKPSLAPCGPLDNRTHVVEPDIEILSEAAALERLNTSKAGLSIAQASQRLRKHGPNTVAVDVPIPICTLLRENFMHTMAVLLWCAGIAAFLAQMPELGTAIWLVNIINGTFSFWQEYRAEKATDALKHLLPLNAKVVREGAVVIIPAVDLVPGDIILVNEGDRIPADARVISAERLQIDQSTLTGESRPNHKTARPFEPNHENNTSVCRPDTPNLLFAGTNAQTGHGMAVVYATGTETEFGRIACLTQIIADQPSPLQKEMVRVTQVVTLLAVSIGATIFAIAMTVTHTVVYAFTFALGMIVAFVPEGMVPTVTLALALAVQRMAKRQALVKRLSSVEALGCTNIICTDKTGTLTENQMTVTHVLAGETDYTVTGLGYIINGTVVPTDFRQTAGQADISELLRAGVLCNNARLTNNRESPTVSGDPTEIALLIAAAKAGLFQQQEETALPRVHENGFDSRRKCMSTIHEHGARKVVYLKGSPTNVLDRCERHWRSGVEMPLDQAAKEMLMRRINDYARQGLRVIAVARRELAAGDDHAPEQVENQLAFLGLFAMFDPPRPEVPSAVKRCREAGMRVVMITGDYELTAEAIARQVGIISDKPARLITGAQLDHMSEQELVELLTDDILFARVNPEHKLHVVRAFQRCGKVVAVTGDGVNDAPALKQADIGIAMGLVGTDVAREAADMILLDDNFASIVNAVEEGRAVYDNIKKFALYVFNSNMAEAVPFVVMLLSCGLIPMPLTVMQILCIDLGTDMLPAIGLGADPAEDNVMQQRPRSLTQPLLSASLLGKALLWYGTIEAVAGMSGYFYLNSLHGWPQAPLAPFGSPVWKAATTMTLACIIAGQIGAVFCCRTQRRSLFSINPFGNRLILAGVLLEVILLAILMYLPAAQAIFSTAPLGLSELCFAFAWTPTVVCLDELRKLILRRVDLHHT